MQQNERDKTVDLDAFITRMPKVELHVHLEGSIQPQTFLALARRHGVALPAADLAGLARWYAFRDFDHFIEIYRAISRCLRTAEDIELIAREFLTEQARQHILYSEVTFTAHSQWANNGLGFHEQMDAVNRARAWGEKELGVSMGVIMDISRHVTPEEGLVVADWAVERYGDGIIALGLGGPEVGNPPEKFREAFDRVRRAGIPCVLHAGETVGPASIWSALEVAASRRIGHGVRAVEDPRLVEHLKLHQIPLEISPTSNLCLKVFPSLEQHPVGRFVAEGLYVTINSDDPPLFNTTLTNEYLVCSRAFGWDRKTLERLVLNAAGASLLPEAGRLELRRRCLEEFEKLAQDAKRGTF